MIQASAEKMEVSAGSLCFNVIAKSGETTAPTAESTSPSSFLEPSVKRKMPPLVREAELPEPYAHFSNRDWSVLALSSRRRVQNVKWGILGNRKYWGKIIWEKRRGYRTVDRLECVSVTQTVWRSSSWMHLDLDACADSTSRRQRLRTIWLELLAKHLYAYLEESRENLSSNGGSQDSASKTLIGMDCRRPRADLMIRYCWRWTLRNNERFLCSLRTWTPYLMELL